VSSGNSAARKPRSGARKRRAKRRKGKKAKRVKSQSLGGTGVLSLLQCLMAWRVTFSRAYDGRMNFRRISIILDNILTFHLMNLHIMKKTPGIKYFPGA
jgi:hypothetical protein